MKNITVFLILFASVWIAIVLLRLSWVLDNMKATCPEGKVCLDQSQYDSITKQSDASDTHNTQSSIPLVAPTYTRERDLRVLNDPLYPAYNRTDRGTFESVIDNTLKRNINIPTQHYNDSYRLIGYVSNEDDEIGRWRLFGKQKDRNRADFYMIPVNRNYELKVQITDKMVIGEKLRDVDTLPEVMMFDSPLLAHSPYTFVELPKGDLTDEIM